MPRMHLVCDACYTNKPRHPRPTHYMCERCEGTQALATADPESASSQGLCNVCGASDAFDRTEGEIDADT